MTDHYKSMFFKAVWYRVQNSVYRRVVASLPSIILLVALAGNAELDRYPQLMDAGGEVRQCLIPSALAISVTSRRAWPKRDLSVDC